MLPFLCLILLLSPIINSEVLIYPLTLHRSISTFYIDEYFSFSMRFQDTLEDVKVSLGSSGFLIAVDKPQYKKSNINIKNDNMYPDNPTSGYITQGIFNSSSSGKEEVALNVLFNKSLYNSKSGLARGVKYPNSDIKELYDLDFMSQLIKQGVIDKYYIYLTPFFDTEGNPRNDASLELGRLPIYFDDKYKFSYTP